MAGVCREGAQRVDVSKYARYASSFSVHVSDHSERRRGEGPEWGGAQARATPEHSYNAQETAAGERKAEAARLEGPGQPLRVSIGDGAH